MLLYVSICSMLLLSLSLFVTFLFEARIKNQSIADVNQQGTQVMYMITESIRNASSVEIPSVGGASSTLSLTVENGLLSPTVFTVGSGTVMITEGSNFPVPLTNSHVTVTGMSFKNISSLSSGDRIIQISFTISYNNSSGRNEYDFSKSFTGSATIRQ